MRIFADLHLHSKYSRATSKDMDIENIEKYAKIRGIDLIGTGDFCQPDWLANLKSKLTEDGSGILRSKTGFPFMLTNELSFIYTEGGKGRRIHNILWAKSFEVADQITEEMLKRGRVDYDGRPIFKMSCPEFTEKMMQIDKDIEIIPAHIWTPWFSVFGSKSGYNTMKECFQEQVNHIHGYETGLSSDPPMNWRVKELDKYTILSNSDSHSFWPWRMGREETIFNINKLSYDDIIKAVRNNEGVETIEVDPNYGKYHIDGHRACNVVFEPNETRKHNGICPVCKKPLTIGVLNRVEELADPDRPEGYKPSWAKPFYSLIPLAEIIANLMSKGIATKNVQAEYYKIVNPEQGRNENKVLLEIPFEELKKLTTERVAQAIIANRNAEIEFAPGYDGEYGHPVFDKEKELEKQKEMAEKTTNLPKPGTAQKGLGDFF